MSNETHVRLLLCHDCKTTEEITDYEGPAERDEALAYTIAPHSHPDGTKHKGQLLRVEKKHWDSPSTRRAIENQIRESAGHTGFDTEFYATKNTLQEDAAKCYTKHNRNPACADYKTEKMRLNPGTDKDRRDLGLAPMRSNHFLCDHCVVKSVVQEKVFSQKGLYK